MDWLKTASRDELIARILELEGRLERKALEAGKIRADAEADGWQACEDRQAEEAEGA